MSKDKQTKPSNKKAAEVEEAVEEEDVTEDDGDGDDDAVVEEGGDEGEGDEPVAAPTKAGKAPKKKGGAGNPGNLVPREPVKVSAEVLKTQTKEIRELLTKREELQAAGDKKGLRKVRAALRKSGFRLSNLPGGTLQKKAEKPAKKEEVAAEEE